MKIKKKMGLLLGLALCASLVLVGCGDSYDEEPSNYEEGYEEEAGIEDTLWKLIGLNDGDGTEITGEALQGTAMADMMLEFQSDGVAVVSSQDQSEEGTWSQDGNEVTTLIEAASLDAKGALEGDLLILYSDDIEMTFEQQ